MCNYNFKLPEDPVAILAMMRPEFEKTGGSVSGKTEDFSFILPTSIGKFNGTCKVTKPMVVAISVTKKPEFVSCGMIKEKLVEYITEAVKTYQKQVKESQSSNGG